MLRVHAIEQLDGMPFRWTRPAFLLRLSFSGSISVTLETRGVRGRIDPSEILVVAGGRVVRDIAIDAEQNIGFHLGNDADRPVESDILIIANETREPSTAGVPGRRFGLPLFSVSLRSSGQ